jgi:murein hydrolase activator
MCKLPVLIITILFSAATCVAQSSSQSRIDLEKERASIQKEIDEAKHSLEITHRNKKHTLGQLALLQKRLRLRKAAILNINRQVSFIQTDMNNSWQEILNLRKELNTLQGQYAESVIYAYKNRTNYDNLNFIFAADDFNDAIKRVEYLRAYRTNREQRAANIVKTQAFLQNKLDGLTVKRREKDDVLIIQGVEKQALENDKKEKNKVVEDLRKHENELKKEMIAKRRQDLKLTRAITAAIRRARADDIKKAKLKVPAIKSPREVTSAHVKSEPSSLLTIKSKEKIVPKNISTSTSDVILSDNFEKGRGRLPWPVHSGTISIRFGPHEVIKSIIHNSAGITIESSPGASVTSVFEGYVQSVFNVEGMTAVMVRHGNYFSTYSNLSEASVSKGQSIKTGQTLGKLSENGQLDFIISDDKYQNFDPEKWLIK